MAIKHFGSCTKNKPISNDKVTSGHLRHSLPGTLCRLLSLPAAAVPAAPTPLGLPQEGPQPTQAPSAGGISSRLEFAAAPLLPREPFRGNLSLIHPGNNSGLGPVIPPLLDFGLF